jgi:hypothetical protein
VLTFVLAYISYRNLDNLASSGLYVQQPEEEELLYDPNNQDWYYHAEDEQFDPNTSWARSDDRDEADQDEGSSASSSTLSSTKLSGKRTYNEFEEDEVNEVEVEEQPSKSPGMYPNSVLYLEMLMSQI